MDASTAGGIAGIVIGVMGGALGTYASIANAKGSWERRLAMRLAALCWAWLGAMVTWLFLMPRPWNQGAILLNLPILLAIPAMNRRLARSRAEDEAGSR